MKQLLTLILSSTILVTMNAQTLKGNQWTAKNVEGAYIVSIEDRASILGALTDFITSQKLQAGQVTGIGATDEATLRFFDPSSKKYVDKTFNEQMEISNLSGNISEADGKLLLHLHVTLGRKDYTALAGHLLDAKIRGAGELFVYPINSKVVKAKNEGVGLYFYDFGHQ
jgi:predicted DNA-binding protein with PD1-like motif